MIMKKLLYLFGLIILIISCHDKSEKVRLKCQLQHVEQDTVYNKTDSTNMVIFNIIHDYNGGHNNCSYNVLFRLNGQFQTKIISDSLIY